MTDSKLYAKILEKCDHIDKEQAKLKTDLHNLTSITGALVAEMHMVNQRLDIANNQEFFKKTLDENSKKRSV